KRLLLAAVLEPLRIREPKLHGTQRRRDGLEAAVGDSLLDVAHLLPAPWMAVRIDHRAAAVVDETHEDALAQWLQLLHPGERVSRAVNEVWQRALDEDGPSGPPWYLYRRQSLERRVGSLADQSEAVIKGGHLRVGEELCPCRIE